MILFYDTETTGIPLFDKRSLDPAQPHITQLAALLVDDNRQVVEQVNAYIKPDGWTVPPSIETLTGVTLADLEAKGRPLPAVMEEFLVLVVRASLMVGHNQGFDQRMVRIELTRLKMDNIAISWKNKMHFDTRVMAQKVLPAKARTALPDVFAHYFGERPENQHDALADAKATMAIYFAMKDKQHRFDKYAHLRVGEPS